MQTIIIKPLITEQSVKDAQQGKFTFLVDKDARKNVIRGAVEKIFNVTVTGISTVSFTRRKTIYTKFGRKNRVTNIKKARVQLKDGQTIAAFDIKGEKEEKKPSPAKVTEDKKGGTK